VLILDDLLLAPLRGVAWIARKIQESVEQRLEDQKKAIMSQLGELYTQLDAGKITQAEFDEREHALLDQLDVINRQLDEAHGVQRGQP
jgi:hypothetical protein